MLALIQEPTQVTVPVWENVNGEWKHVQTTVPVIDVHELLDYLHNDLKLQCPMDETENYWRHLRESGMPHARKFPGCDQHIPFSLYGDEACLGDPKDKVTGIFLSLTLFRPKAARHGHFLLFAMQDDIMVHSELQTLRPILEHIVWTCNLAFEGRYPSTNMYGEALTPSKQQLAGKMIAQGHRFACAELKGDWKYHERVLRLARTPVSTNCCFLCGAQANDGPQRYYDITEGAGWRFSVYNTPAFIVQCLRPGPLSILDYWVP